MMVKNKFNPKVSIVIPVYNGSNYLKEAIDSALAQTYKNIEIIVVNDGSTDNGATEKIALSYGGKIRYFKKTNGGVATALNFGIEKMTGDYFSWLSHDDMYRPNKIEIQIRFLEQFKNRKIVLYSNYYIYDVSRNVETKVNIPTTEFENKPEYLLFREALNGITLLVPRIAFDRCGVFNVNLRTTQDYDMWFKFMQDGYEFVHQQDYLASYRVHANQDTKKSTVKNTENDELFVSFLKMLNTEDMVRLEGSVDNFYTQINLFISGRDFRKTKAYIEAKINDNENYIFSIFEEKNKKIIEKIKNLHAKVTIITPTYNRDNLIPHTIKSVLAQEYKDYVYIILDDGSNDNTKKVVLDLIKGKKNCFYIYNENIGEAETVNLGWNLCESGYFLQVNSDDTIEPNLLSEVVPLLEKNTQHVLAYPDFYFINDEGEVIDECKNEDWDFINALSDFSCHAAAPGTFIRKDSFKGLKKIKDGRFKYINDINMLWNMALKGDFLHVPKPLASWRSHAEGISTDRYKSINEVTTWVDEYFSQKNLPIQVKDIELKCRQSIDDYCIKLIQDSDTDSVVANYTRDLNERFKKLLLEKEDLLASKSWKITKPLRYIFIKLEDFKSRIRK